MKNTILALIVLTLLSTACSRREDIPVQVAISAPQLLKDMKVELYADGAPARLLRMDENFRNSFELGRIFEIHAVLEGDKKKIPALKLKALFGCGWREQALTLDPDAGLLRAAAAGRVEPPYFDITLQPFPGSATNLWVDNRRGGPAELGLGAIKVPIPAGKITPVQVATCETAIPVSFGGAPMGEIPAYSAFAATSTILLDPSGKGCYQLYTVRYRLQHEQGIPGGSSGVSQRLSGKRLYDTGHMITYMFQKPPATITAPRGAEISNEVLEDAKCK